MLELGIAIALAAERIGARQWERIVNPEQRRPRRRKSWVRARRRDTGERPDRRQRP